jgi:hypothetical protein
MRRRWFRRRPAAAGSSGPPSIDVSDAAANVKRFGERTDTRRTETIALIAGIGVVLAATLWLAGDLLMKAPTV